MPVVNLKNISRAEAAAAVRIDRQTRWGNPYVIGKHGTRAEVIARYRADLRRRLRTGDVTLADLAALHGKTLACWCAPEPCHGDVLARAAAWAAAELNRSVR